jgi:hypothetical protein
MIQDNLKNDKKELDKLFAKVQETRIKIFIQTLEIKEDTSITRIYSALQTVKK